jgi:hypothetical protein
MSLRPIYARGHSNTQSLTRPGLSRLSICRGMTGLVLTWPLGLSFSIDNTTAKRQCRYCIVADLNRFIADGVITNRPIMLKDRGRSKGRKR